MIYFGGWNQGNCLAELVRGFRRSVDYFILEVFSVDINTYNT